jgi:preprotein translocase subunit SecD
MLSCAILWWFGSTFAASLIVGFATTLFIGVVISMLTAVLVSRTFLRLVLAGARPTHRAFFGAGS